MSDIAHGIGIQLNIDEATTDEKFGHYTRVLVEIDVSVKPIVSLMIKRVEKSFFLEVAYENLPAFYSTCSSKGHIPNACRLNKANYVRVSNNC